MTLFQSLANAAGYDPVRGPGSSCNPSNTSGQCVLPWGGGTKAVSSVVLIANGLSFAVSFHFNSISVIDPFTCRCKVLTVLFTTIGSAADYGSFGRWLLLVITCTSWAAMSACLSLTCTCPMLHEPTTLNPEIH
jgi:Vacuole effluxer Atg22 like